MEYINVNCNKCTEFNTEENVGVIIMEYDVEIIKNVFESNYIVYIKICKHNIDQFKKLSIDYSNDNNYIAFTHFSQGYYLMINRNYINLYGCFNVGTDYYNPSKLDFSIYLYLGGSYSINVDQFINIIKKGTLICSIYPNIVCELEKILEQNTDFILRKIQKKNIICFIIETLPPITKRAIK